MSDVLLPQNLLLSVKQSASPSHWTPLHPEPISGTALINTGFQAHLFLSSKDSQNKEHFLSAYDFVISIEISNICEHGDKWLRWEPREGHTGDILKVVAEIEPVGITISMNSEAKQAVRDNAMNRYGKDGHGKETREWKMG